MIGELARRLTPAQELEFTTDVDRILALAPLHPCGRPAAVTQLDTTTGKAPDPDPRK